MKKFKEDKWPNEAQTRALRDRLYEMMRCPKCAVFGATIHVLLWCGAVRVRRLPNGEAVYVVTRKTFPSALPDVHPVVLKSLILMRPTLDYADFAIRLDDEVIGCPHMPAVANPSLPM